MKTVLALIIGVLLFSCPAHAQKKDTEEETVEYTSTNNGHVLKHYNSGQIKSDMIYKNDTIQSTILYWKNGNIQFTYDYSYSNDTTTITQKFYSKKGILIYSNTTVNGLNHGHNLAYYKNGDIRVDAQDVYGVRVMELVYRKGIILKKKITCDAETKDCRCRVYSKEGQLKNSYTTEFKGYRTVLIK